MLVSFFVLALIGFSIALYAYIIEQKVLNDPAFRPLCEISDRISCIRPIKSQYANLFFLSNAVLGMGYYGLVAVLSLLHAPTLLLIATSFGVITSSIFAYFLYFKIRTLCVICTSLYVINIILLFLSVRSF